MMLFRPGDTVPKTGIYQCIFCRTFFRFVQGQLFPNCTEGCENPRFVYSKINK